MADDRESDTEVERNAKANGRKKNDQPILPSADTLLKPSDSFTSAVDDNDFSDLFWDQIIKYATTAMIALTLLDLVSSIRGDTVQCLTPSNFTRDQGAFVNSYCSQFTPPTDYFPLYLVAQATVIYGVHFLWYSWFSGKFQYFLAIATSLDRCRDITTGSYSLRNFVLCRTLLNSFKSSKAIFISYTAKLLLQVVLSALSIYFSFDINLFGYYSAPYVCPRDDSDNDGVLPVGGYHIPCILTSLILLVAVRWLNVILLLAIVIIALYGLAWCLWDHKSRLNWVLVAQFSFQSGLPPIWYIPKGYILAWNCWKYFYQYRIRNDFDFLLLKLYREDAGHAQVMREVLIDDCIRRGEQRQFERLNLWRNLRDPSLVEELKTIEGNNQSLVEESETTADIENESLRAQPKKALGDTIQKVLYNSLTAKALKLKRLDILDIAFGTSGYKLQLAAKSDRVVAVDLNPYYLNEEEPVCKKLYTAGITHFKTLANIFSKEKNCICKFRKQLVEEYFEEDDEIDENFPVANVIVVGPIPAESDGSNIEHLSQQDKCSRTIPVYWLLKWMQQEHLLHSVSYLVTVTPQTIEGKSVSDHFVEFKPDARWETPIILYKQSEDNMFKLHEELSTSIAREDQESEEEPPCESSMIRCNNIVTIKCGQSSCNFMIKMYCIPKV
jgi:hypothetical protein